MLIARSRKGIRPGEKPVYDEKRRTHHKETLFVVLLTSTMMRDAANGVKPTWRCLACALFVLALLVLVSAQDAGDEVKVSSEEQKNYTSRSAAMQALREKLLSDYDRGTFPPAPPGPNGTEAVTVQVSLPPLSTSLHSPTPPPSTHSKRHTERSLLTPPPFSMMPIPLRLGGHQLSQSLERRCGQVR